MSHLILWNELYVTLQASLIPFKIIALHNILLFIMAKNTYETYEFLQTSAEEEDAGQFFVVQDNGTFLSEYLLLVLVNSI